MFDMLKLRAFFESGYANVFCVALRINQSQTRLLKGVVEAQWMPIEK